MEEQKEYAVLRFLDQNGWSYMVNDCTKGRLLMEYIKSEVKLEKGRIFEWVRQITVQLEQYYRCEGEDGAYGYVNPYAIVIGEENNIFLLDVKEPENEDLVRQMRKKKVRILFVRQEHALTQKTERMDDLYGLGKIMGFLVEKCVDQKAFTKKEERMWKRLQAKCYGNNKAVLKTLKAVQKELQILENGKKQKKKSWKILWILALICMIGVVLIRNPIKLLKPVSAAEKKEEIQENPPEQMKLEQVEMANSEPEQKNVNEESEDAYLELGLLYYEEKRDYENSILNLEKAGEENELAKGYQQIMRYLQRGNMENVEEKSVETILDTVTRELENMPDEKLRNKEFLYHYPIIKFCELSECHTGWFKMKEIGKEMENKKEWQKWETDGSKEKELRLSMVSAYQGIGLSDKMVEEYEYIKELPADRDELENIYVKMLELYELLFKKEKAWETCHEAVERVKDSEKLWLKYITYYCEDASIDRGICAEAVRKAVNAMPEICNTEQFGFLQTTYGIRIEGDMIMVGVE